MTSPTTMDGRTRHPLSAAFGDMPEDEKAALTADVAANGLLNAIVTSEDGRILDGWHRYRACLAAGVPPRFEPFTYVVEPAAEAAGRTMTEAEFVIAQNAHRRHLTREQRRNVVAELLKADPAQSDRRIATAAKVDHKTVAAVRRDAEATGEIPQLTRTTGRDGKARPVTKPKQMTTAAQAVGMSVSDYARASEVVEAAEQHQEQFGDIVETMDATGNVTEAYNELRRRRGVGEALSEAHRATAELDATLRQARETLDPTLRADAAWRPIRLALAGLHALITEARRLPACPPAAKQEMVDSWEPVARILGARLEPPAVHLRRSNSWRAVIPLMKPDAAVATLLKLCPRHDLVKLYSELGYALHQHGAISNYPEAMREMLAKIDADKARAAATGNVQASPDKRIEASTDRDGEGSSQRAAALVSFASPVDPRAAATGGHPIPGTIDEAVAP